MACAPERVYKVALFGVTGCGKSSIINLLADKAMAEVSTGVEACTRRAQWYPVELEGMNFRLWDTMGFNQAETRDIDPLSPYEQANALLQNLPDGVDLILLCARKDGINASFRNLYWLLDSFFFRGRAPIALVLTHFDTPDPDWWDRNMHTISQRCNFPAHLLPHVCISTVHNGYSQAGSMYHQSRETLRDLLLQEHAVAPIPLRLDLSSDTISSEAAEDLKNYCQLNVHDAMTLVKYFRSPRRLFHVILFGDSGAGKSSVINLISGSVVAKVSSRFENCTLDFRSYEITTGLQQFLVWDTVGFNGVYKGNDMTGKALENAARLVRDLHQKGGVDLLVFCKRYGRLGVQESHTLRLFQEFLCDDQVPVAFVVTHLETYNPMEMWWEENGIGLLQACSLKQSAIAGHACITSAPESPLLRDKLLLSRKLVQNMLEDSISFGQAFNKDEGIWVMSFLRRVAGMIRASSSRKEKLSTKNVMDRCGLNREQATELIRLLRE